MPVFEYASFCHSANGLMEAVLEQITRTLGKQIQMKWVTLLSLPSFDVFIVFLPSFFKRLRADWILHHNAHYVHIDLQTTQVVTI